MTMTNGTVETLKRAIPYIKLYRGKAFVVKVGGDVVRERELVDGIAADLTLLSMLGIRTVLVHGGGSQATEVCRRLGIEPRIVAGRRVTDEQTLEVAKMVYAGTINIDLLGALRRQGSAAVGVSGVDGGLLTARRRDKSLVRPGPDQDAVTVDFGLVGEIEQVNAGFLGYLLDGGQIPVVSSLAADDEGNIYNVNADTVACEIAAALAAEKLLLLTDTVGLLGDPADSSSLISYADIEEVQALRQRGAIAGGMLPKVEACIRALERGVRRTHILDGRRPGALLVEIFTNAGCGTMIVDSRERQSYLAELARAGPRGASGRER
jgi:acetylglutamate kinase